jgi:hypothetical protein
MATYGGAVDLILTELARSDTSITAVVEREILKAIEFYAPQKFWFNEGRISFTASATILYPFSSMSAVMLEIDQVSTAVNGGVIELLPENHAELNRMDVSGFTGHPTRYAIFGEQMRLYPMPATGTTYQVNIDGTKRLASLTASTDTNEWLDEGLNLIAARVEKNLCARKFKDYDAAQVYQLAEQEELARLLERTTRLLSTGKLKGNW